MKHYPSEYKKHIGRNLLISLFIAGVFFFAYSIFSFQYIRTTIKDANQVEENHEHIIESLYLLKNALIDQETGQRGYGLSGNEEFLEPFYSGREKYKEISKNLLNQADQYPTLKRDIEEIIHLGNQWYNEFGLTQIEQKMNGEEISTTDLKGAKQLFDHFRKMLDSKVDEVQEDKLVKTDHVNEKIDQVIWRLSVLTCMLLAVMMIIVYSQIKKIVDPIIALEKSVVAYASKNFKKPVPPYHSKNELGRLIAGVDKMRAELQQKFEQVQQQADRDGLTGIHNRRVFDAFLSNQVSVSKETEKPFCLILFDIDHFKRFNDNFGHLEGDRILIYVTQLISKRIRKGDMFARYGGEEFAVVLSNTTVREGRVVAEDLRRSIEAERLDEYQITASFGVSEFLEGDSENSIIKRTDDALYEAKQAGRNRVVAK